MAVEFHMLTLSMQAPRVFLKCPTDPKKGRISGRFIGYDETVLKAV
jgi:hypothetical protein